jgi:large subunit ribosomal protein L22
MPMPAAVEEPRTQVRAEARYVRTAPRKAQLVTEQIRGRTVPEARTILAFMTRDAARDVERVLSSAVANAETNHNLDGDDLYVSLAVVGAGPTLKRWRARARGRVARIKKRTCHITIALALPEGAVIPAPRPAPAPAPGAEPPTEEEAKPKRATREKAEEKPAADEAPAAEEKPKTTRKRAVKPKADETKAEKAGPKPKPKRPTTRKKTEES